MAVKLGNGNWAVKEDKLLAYNDNSGRFFNKEFDFSRGSIATYVGKDGLIKSAASDVPRIDFSDSTNGALLLEPQSTNLFPYSNDFSQWDSLSGASVINNALVSPDGTLNADEFVFDGTDNGRVEDPVSTTNGLVYTFSIYLKNKDIANPTQVFIGNGTTTEGEFVTITNEWQRFTTTQTANGTSEYPRVRYNGVGSLYAYGAQIEQQSFATSYIPTSGSATTRLADACNNSGSAQDFNSEEGVLYAEYKIGGDSTDNFQIITLRNTNSGSEIIGIGKQNFSNDIFIRANIGSVNLFNNLSATPIDGYNKVAISYKSGNSSAWVNGTKVHSSSSTFTPSSTIGRLSFQWEAPLTFNFYGKTKNLQVFTEAKSDEFLAALTTI